MNKKKKTQNSKAETKKTKPNKLQKISEQTKKKITKTHQQSQENDTQAQEREALKRSFFSHINQILNSKLFRAIVVLTSSFIILFTLLSFWEHKKYQISLINHVPAETLVSLLEVNQNPYLTQPQLLKQSPDQEQIQQFINLDQVLLNQTEITPTLKQSNQKMISYHLYQGQLYPVFIYRLQSQNPISFPIQTIKTKSDSDWQYTQKGEFLVVSTNKELNQTFFNSEIPKINSSQTFIETLNQIPNRNLAWFTINHQNLQNLTNDTQFPRNPFSNYSSLIQTLDFTTGYFQVNQQGLFISSYTNPDPNLEINLSPIANLDKFNPELHEFLPPLQDIEYIFSGTELSAIINTLLDNLNQTTSNPTISLKNFFTRQNLSSDALSTTNKILSKEYLIYKSKNSTDLHLVLPKQPQAIQQEILNIASQLESYNSPIIQAYQLPDGSLARNKVSSPIKDRVLTDTRKPITIYLKDAKKYIKLDFSNPNHESISLQENQQPVLGTSKSIQSTQTKPQAYLPILEEGSSHFYASQDLISQYLSDQELTLYPFSLNSSSYFFDDGLQSVFQLTW